MYIYKENKEYIRSPNINNNNLDIFTLSHSEEKEDLSYEIKQDLYKADKERKGSVSEKELLEYFQSKFPPNKQLNKLVFE
jgi:RNA polymerase-interacting CarD/CdnL/TRCF family regulator